MIFPRHTSLVIGGSAAGGSFLSGTPTLLNEEPSLTQDGWDSLTANFAIRRATLTAEELAALWPIGTKLGNRNWWVTGAKPACVAPGVWTAAVECKGYAGGKPCKINWGAAVDQQSAGRSLFPITPATFPLQYATYAKVSVSEAVPTFTVAYLSPNVESGWPASPIVPSLRVGRERVTTPGWTDPVTGASITPPPVPASVWTYLVEYVYHWPNGWVLMDLQADILPGTRAGLVTESYKYIRDKTP